jgi:rhodanese-related sulfurtransferase
MSLLPDPAATEEISPAAMAEWIDLPADQRPRVIDCREEDEIAICQIAGSEWIPLAEFPAKSAALTENGGQGVVVVCHHGMRSLRGARFLRSVGINAFSMRGGIDAWAKEIDAEMARY